MVFGDGQSNSVIQIYHGLSLVSTATKLGTKWAITQILLEIWDIFVSMGGFSGLGHRILPTKFYPDRPLLPTKFETKGL